ncbi:MAG: hypothetical protein ACM3NV_00015 [Syntrophothermus sp.]
MTNRRARAAATATVLGLGALGGVALGSNPGVQGLQTASQQAGPGAVASATTGASGAAALPSQSVAVKSASTGAPIVTRASGGGAVRDD